MNCLYATDFPPSQNVAQGYFIMGSHAEIENHEWLILKKAWPHRHFPSAVPKAGIVWEDCTLRPSVQSTTTHPAQIPDELAQRQGS